MKQEIALAFRSLSELFRFLLWYVAGVALLLWALPNIAEFVQSQYEAMSGGVRFTIVAGFLLLVAAWQFFARDGRKDSDQS